MVLQGGMYVMAAYARSLASMVHAQEASGCVRAVGNEIGADVERGLR